MTEPHMLARTSDPDTSQDAAAVAALSPQSRDIKSAILHALRRHGPRTAFELRELYLVDGIGPACQPNTINRRVSDLANIGLVVDTGTRRKTPDNRSAIVWRVVSPAERGNLLRYYGMPPLMEVEVDWSKVRDVTRLRERIRELEAEVARLRAQHEPQRYEVG